MYSSILKKIYAYNYPSVEQINKEYNIILCSDKNLINQMLVLISSLAVNLKRKINLFVLQSDFTPDDKNTLTDFCSNAEIGLNLIDIDMSEFDGFRQGRIPKQTYFYFKAHEVLPSDIDRALLLDVDIIVLKDIAKFYDVDFEDAWAAACEEYQLEKMENYLRALYNEPGHSFIYEQFFCTECIINSGVVLLNLKKFRDEKITLESFSQLQNEKDEITKLTDQILFNRFVRHNVKIFPKLYFNCWSAHENSLRKLFETEGIKNEVYQYNVLDENYVNSIVHFTAYPSTKPWKSLQFIDREGNWQFLKFANEDHKKNVLKWWEIAKTLPENNLNELMIVSMCDQFPMEKNRGARIESDLEYFKAYTKIFRKFMECNDKFNDIIQELIASGYRNIGFFGFNQVGFSLIPYFEKKGLKIRYVVENYKEKPQIINNLLPRDTKSFPEADLTIVMDVKNSNRIKDNLKNFIKNPLITIWDLYDLIDIDIKTSISAAISFLTYYTPKIIMSKNQLETIAKIINKYDSKCNLLIFGCGEDSKFWKQINIHGNTMFLETSPEWYDKILKKYPDLNIQLYDLGKNTVANSMKGRFEFINIPSCLLDKEWDIILVDAPQGYAANTPGRALPIIWTNQIKRSDTQIFVHDFERDLEKLFTGIFIGKTEIIYGKDKIVNQLAWNDPEKEYNAPKYDFIDINQISKISQTINNNEYQTFAFILFPEILFPFLQNIKNLVLNSNIKLILYIIDLNKKQTVNKFPIKINNSELVIKTFLQFYDDYQEKNSSNIKYYFIYSKL